jgi:inner membrane protein involved in colicin E2 resistance
MRGLFLSEVFMKKLVKALQYIGITGLSFVLFYSIYLMFISVTTFVLPIFFLIALVVVVGLQLEKEE